MSGYVYTGGELLTMHEIDRIVDAVRNIGNGDYGQGEIILLELSDRLHHARDKHPWPRDAADATEAAMALLGEAEEVVAAAAHEGPKRTRDEFFDNIAVATRGINEEWR